ncbi:LAME_0H08504g1_1 [Lachancea meyersii CBS 8951]|uniref:LAME_0H08504g1_1 n=1 Tax=Lachancea meyersii CBS 8951 TaxID=1266667 RepID=A0A1G4KFT0_9SACH|nr:LAME_0H08504g1_1 [Lachancea meyersii CBS 8951]
MAQRTPKTKPNSSSPYTLGPPGKPKTSHYRSSSFKAHQGSKNAVSGLTVSSELQTPAATSSAPEMSSPSESNSLESPKSPLEAYRQHQNHHHHHQRQLPQQQAFTLNHQRAILEHRLITKNSVPQKNYSHVPCRFFRQGTCQAGDSCPFSHSLNSVAADATPCKYFERGHCRFGNKCANAHILPDGTRVHPSKQFNSGNRSNDAGPPPISISLRDTELSQFPQQKMTAALASPSQRLPPVATHGTFISLPTLHQQTAYESAIDEEDDCEDFDGEDFIPGELSDLLTPKELERRNSRSSLTRKLSWTDHASAITLSSEQLNGYEAASLSSTRNSFSGISSANSTDFSPPSTSMAFGLMIQSFDYTYQQDKHHAMSMWGAYDTQSQIPYANINQLSLQMSRINVHGKEEDHRVAEDLSLKNGRGLHPFYLGDLHQQV